MIQKPMQDVKHTGDKGENVDCHFVKKKKKSKFTGCVGPMIHVVTNAEMLEKIQL